MSWPNNNSPNVCPHICLYVHPFLKNPVIGESWYASGWCICQNLNEPSLTIGSHDSRCPNYEISRFHNASFPRIWGWETEPNMDYESTATQSLFWFRCSFCMNCHQSWLQLTWLSCPPPHWVPDCSIVESYLWSDNCQPSIQNQISFAYITLTNIVIVAVELYYLNDFAPSKRKHIENSLS